jgi:hypothetical protein
MTVDLRALIEDKEVEKWVWRSNKQIQPEGQHSLEARYHPGLC